MLTDGLRLLVEWQAETTLQADGEVLLPDGAAVAWRELIRQQRRVLVKHAGGVALREQESLITC
jgi:phosphoribosyl-dephospho-CoA transferase